MNHFCDENEFFKLIEIDDDDDGLDPIYDKFDFNEMSINIYGRFIELLTPITNHFFRRTTKYYYTECLDVRGVEVDHLEVCRGSSPHHGDISIHTGALYLSLQQVPQNWIKYLVVLERCSVHLSFKSKLRDLNFVKKFSYLSFKDGLPPYQRQYIHPGLKKIKVHVLRSVNFKNFLNLLMSLDICENLEFFDFKIGSRKSLGNFSDWKRALEQFFQRHKPFLEHCQVECQFKLFKIHENHLCYRQEDGVFVRNFNFQSLGW